RILGAPEPPLAVGLSLAFQWRAPEFLALAVALREEGYRGHITAGGHFATFAAAELLRDFPALDSICRQEAEETLVALARALAEMQRARGIDIFVFHDDNFFIPNHAKSLARLNALADAIEAQGMRAFATVVKARPNDATPEVFRVLVERLKCIRCYIGVETD